ncbi:MAG TPA: hypothetical protein VF745_04045 [Steroidobacteraceae bacterium]
MTTASASTISRAAPPTARIPAATPSSSYTIAATCNYDLYAPAAVLGQSGYQTLHWTVLDNVSVAANTTTTVTLPSTTTTNVVN